MWVVGPGGGGGGEWVRDVRPIPITMTKTEQMQNPGISVPAAVVVFSLVAPPALAKFPSGYFCNSTL